MPKVDKDPKPPSAKYGGRVSAFSRLSSYEARQGEAGKKKLEAGRPHWTSIDLRRGLNRRREWVVKAENDKTPSALKRLPTKGKVIPHLQTNIYVNNTLRSINMKNGEVSLLVAQVEKIIMTTRGKKSHHWDNLNQISFYP